MIYPSLKKYCLKIHTQAMLLKEQAEQEKIRITLNDNRGKSGGGRVIYVDIFEKSKIYLLFAYPKNVQENLNAEQKKAIRNRSKLLKRSELHEQP